MAPSRLIILNKDEKRIADLSNRGSASPVFEAVHREQLNGENTLEFSVDPRHVNADQTMEENTVLYLDPDLNWNEFIIRSYDDENGEVFGRTVYAEHVSTELIDHPIELLELNTDVTGMVEQVLNGSRWQAGTINITSDPSEMVFRDTNGLEALHEIINSFQGELRFRTEVSGNRITGRFVDVLAKRGNETGKRFVYGKDILNIRRNIETVDLITAIIPKGKTLEDPEGGQSEERLDISTVTWSREFGDPLEKPKGETILKDPVSLEKWGKPYNGEKMHRARVVIFDEIEDPEELIQKGYEALSDMRMPFVTYELNVLDLERASGYNHEAVRLGDTVLVVDRTFTPEIRLLSRIVELERDLVNEEESKITLGNFTPIYKEDEERKDFEDEFRDGKDRWDGSLMPGDPIDTDWLSGYIDLLNNEIYGHSQQMQIRNDAMEFIDKPVDQNPTKSVRINPFGVAVSNKKENGIFIYENAITGDGIIASAIKVGTMVANRVKGGSLTLGGKLDDGGLPVHGHLWIYNADDELVMDFDGAYGGIHRLKVGELHADNVIESSTPSQEKGLNHIYVREAFWEEEGKLVTGDDVKGDGSKGKPFRTIERAFQAIPKDNNADWVIHAGASETSFKEHLIIGGYRGDGIIRLYMEADARGYATEFYGWVRMSSCKQKFEFYGGYWLHDGTGSLRNDDDGGHAVFHIYRSETLWLEGCHIWIDGRAKYGVAISQNSFAYLKHCSVSNYDSKPVQPVAGVVCMRGSKVVLDDCGGWVSDAYGLYVHTSSIGCITGSDPIQAINGMIEDPEGGYHPNTSAVRATRTGLYLGPSTVNGGFAQYPVTYWYSEFGIRPNAYESWRRRTGGNYDDGAGAFPGVMQGAAYYPHVLDPDTNSVIEDAYGGQNFGFIWFSSADLSRLSGKDIPTIRLRIKREAMFGANKKHELRICPHNITYPSGGLSSMPGDWDPLSDSRVYTDKVFIIGGFLWGDYFYVDLPPEFGDMLAGISNRGNAKGFMFYHNDMKNSAQLDPDAFELDTFIWL